MRHEKREQASRQEIIAARAYFDVDKYVKIIDALPKKDRDYKGLNTVDGDPVLMKAKKDLVMDTNEMKFYFEKILFHLDKIRKEKKRRKP